ncbi:MULTISPECIES: lysophospholipid acyltransferase family protein [Halocynthiibacter]|uniref:Lysophospholipid acyltransferase family protein n=1 Tax=Halocynthiibacter halioticoli TaxID=2986804 RepID=A0AAE3LR13_9RHOB|nr:MULTISPECIES: lysophospholipid acyltransferase family protein [Halocynthiibacter]MCV6824054.1 lysophospholipid acyltransferase family protein [Halocynthiibacter halioticoli]MCW4057055.1 lysophospholipid acyltransferase family protein [Halocynthiibacter sp. SDUM655004]
MSFWKKASYFIQYIVFLIIIEGTRILPFNTRRNVVGWITAHVIAPMVGWPNAIKRNLGYIFPDMSPEEMKPIATEVSRNVGRTICENFSGKDFRKFVADIPMQGGGVEDLREAVENKRPVILVSGHFGNYDAIRAKLGVEGVAVGALYRPTNNEFFNPYYARRLEENNAPLFGRGRKGLAQMLKFLRQGNTIAILNDQHMSKGAKLKFMGKRAKTAVSAAEMALKYNALLIPVYGVRKNGGLDFDIIIDPPIPHSEPLEMTQMLNDSLEKHVRENLGQWLWGHTRWRFKS